MSAVANPFIPPISTYQRDVAPARQYIEQAAAFLHTSTGRPIERCREFVKTALKNGYFPQVVDPKVTYLKRSEETGDRAEATTTLSAYIAESMHTGEIMAPTLTCYLPASKKPSVLVDFIDKNVKKRSKFKKAMFAAKAAQEAAQLSGDVVEEERQSVLAFFGDTDQRNTKLSNNAISGSHASASTPLSNKTAHNTLTSHCRMTSGSGNANNEKLLSGNRHYWSYHAVINNITSIISHTDYHLLSKVIAEHDLHIPSAEEVMSCITWSSDRYWYAPMKMAKIRHYVEKLSGLQRAAFVYTGDLFHVLKHNEPFMRGFVEALSKKVPGVVEDPLKAIRAYPEDYVNLAHQICSNEMKAMGHDYQRMVGWKEVEPTMFAVTNDKGFQDLQTLVTTAENINQTLTRYADFIRVTMVTENIPASIPRFPESVRCSALTSDTDSTIFTVQDWVEWYFGGMEFHEQAIAVGASMIFIASQAIVHVLARLSKNAGIADDRLYQTAMKNEFYFPVFVPTNEAKHYYAIMSAQEGSIFEKYKTEIKGVHLKSSTAPKTIRKGAADLMLSCMTTVAKGEKIKLLDVLRHVADTERAIQKGIEIGDRTYFRTAELKTPDSYTKDEEDSPYMHHLFWEQTMSVAYGSYGAPPYPVIKVSTKLTSARAMVNWMNNMENRQLAHAIQTWCTKYNKNKLPSLLIPVDAVEVYGIPKEIMEVMDVRKMVSDISAMYYKILETLGFYGLNKNVTNLVSDRY